MPTMSGLMTVHEGPVIVKPEGKSIRQMGNPKAYETISLNNLK